MTYVINIPYMFSMLRSWEFTMCLNVVWLPSPFPIGRKQRSSLIFTITQYMEVGEPRTSGGVQLLGQRGLVASDRVSQKVTFLTRSETWCEAFRGPYNARTHERRRKLLEILETVLS